MWKWVKAWRHRGDNQTEYFELMSHITGAVVQTPLTLNKNTLKIHVNTN
jgi:hypothetical protein